MKGLWNRMSSSERYELLIGFGYSDCLAVNKFSVQRWETLPAPFRYRLLRLMYLRKTRRIA